MAGDIKLSAIPTTGYYTGSTDQLVGVRSGSTAALLTITGLTSAASGALNTFTAQASTDTQLTLKEYSGSQTTPWLNLLYADGTTSLFKFWKNGGTGTAAEIYSGASAGTYITNPNGVSLVAGSATASLVFSGPHTRWSYNYGSYQAYADLNSDGTFTFTTGGGAGAVGAKASLDGNVAFFARRNSSTSTGDIYQAQDETGAKLRTLADAKGRPVKNIVTAADATSITPNTDTADITYQANTQAAGTLTINADGGTPVNGQTWLLKLKCTNAQTFSWNALYVSGSGTGAVTLPTATTGSGKIDLIGFMYDSVNSKWQCIAYAPGY